MDSIDNHQQTGNRGRALVCALATLDKCPRPLRVTNLLKDRFDVTYAGFASNVDGVGFIPINRRKSIFVKIIRLIGKVFRLHSLVRKITFRLDNDAINDPTFDLVVCHDIQLLPYLSLHSKRRVILDLREFYPRQFDNNLFWSTTEKPFFDHLCKRYLDKVDHCITVSTGLRDAYAEVYHVTPSVIHSYAPASDLTPCHNTENTLKLLYHGGAIQARGIHNLIHAMDELGSKAELDLMLVGEGPYYNELVGMVSGRTNVRIIPAVLYSEIVGVTNQYDIGLIFYPPSTFNIDNCMPNKLFEMIQAKVPVISSPLKSLKSFVHDHQIGWVTEDFTVGSLVQTIRQIERPEIIELKENMASIAGVMSQEFANHDLLKLLLANDE